MPLTESHLPQYSTASISHPQDFITLDQSGSFYDAPYQQSVGKCSLASSSDAASVQKRMMELVRDMLSCQGHMRLANSLLGMFPMYVDMDEFVTTINQQAVVKERERYQLLAKLQATFEAEPLDDGMDHPAERIIGELLESTEDQYIFDLFSSFSLDEAHPNFAASVLRCLGRQVHPRTVAWRTDLVRNALRMNNIEIRDAAVQAAELWGDDEIRNVLEQHSEPKPWLQDYISNVIADLDE